MTKAKFLKLLKTLGIPVAYRRFKKEKNKLKKPPFLVYYRTDNDDIHADDITFFSSENIVVELYCTDRNESLEKALEKIFTDNEIPYKVVDETYIESEDLSETIYEIQI